MAPRVECVTRPLPGGEAPHWDAASQCIYFVEVWQKKIHRYVPSSNEHTVLNLKGDASFVIPVEGKENTLLAGMGKKVAVITWDGRSAQPLASETLCDVETQPGREDYRLNDAKADATGRVWSGTMGKITDNIDDMPRDAIALSIEKGGKPVTRFSGVGMSNGIAWSGDSRTMFYNDSLKYTVDAMDYELSTGNVSNRRVLFDLKKHNIEGVPDGMTIDTEERLWVAVFGYVTGKVLCIDSSSGALLKTLDIPVSPEVTSVAFGGANLDELYVTTACLVMNEELRKKHPDAGSLCRVTGLNATGRPGQAAKLF